MRPQSNSPTRGTLNSPLHCVRELHTILMQPLSQLAIIDMVAQKANNRRNDLSMPEEYQIRDKFSLASSHSADSTLPGEPMDIDSVSPPSPQASPRNDAPRSSSVSETTTANVRAQHFASAEDASEICVKFLQTSKNYAGRCI